MIDQKVQNLKQKIREQLPQYSLRETLLLYVDNFANNIEINTQWVENLFLLQGEHWKIVGEVLATLKITKLDISLSNFSVRIGRTEQHMDWDNFIHMLKDTSIFEMKIGADVPMNYHQQIRNILENNCKKNISETSFSLVGISMKKILEHGIWYKGMLPTELEERLDAKSREIKPQAGLFI